MDRLTTADRVFIVLSEQYLRSEYCMYELFGIWRRSEHNYDKFRGRVIPVVLPGVTIDTPEARAGHARYWKDQHARLDAILKDDPSLLGAEDFKKFKAIGDYRLHIGDILCLLNDRLVPREIAHLERSGFADLLPLVQPSEKAGRRGSKPS